MRQPRSSCQDKARPSSLRAATQSLSQVPNLNPRHTTNPPDSCLSRSFMIGDNSEGWSGVNESLAAPPGGRLWHGFPCDGRL
jgi:hypothetical protein